jgi:hypothetical protein
MSKDMEYQKPELVDLAKREMSEGQPPESCTDGYQAESSCTGGRIVGEGCISVEQCPNFPFCEAVEICTALMNDCTAVEYCPSP